MTTSQSQKRIGKVLDGTYRLDRLLGEGGVGAVYAAWHLPLSRQFAVKVLHPQFAGHGESLERFKLEAQLLNRVKHAAFVEVFDFGHDTDGTAYMVMEMVEGEPLRTRLQRGKLLSMSEALELFGPLCEAMEKAHQQHVLHRDLKPDNLMITKKGGVKILDFGMAKLLSEAKHLTSDQVVMGTPNYLAPERARGRKDADARSDIFAMGAILYEALTGQFAFSGATALDTMRKVVSAPIERLSLPDAELAKRLDEVIATACAKDPRDRYASAMELWKALEGTIAEQPLQPKPPEEQSLQKVKANLIQATLIFVREVLGGDKFQRLRQRYGVAEFDELMGSLASDWRDMNELHHVHSIMNELFDDGSYGLMRAVGRYFADMALSTTYKSFLNSGGPLTLVRRAQIMYTAMSSMGELKVVQLDEERWCIRLGKIPRLTESLLAATAGWAERYLELSGATNIRFFGQKVTATESGSPVGEVDFSFEVP